MKRLVVVALAAVGLAVVPLAGLAAPGPEDDVNGPRCANILEGLASYDTDAGTARPTVTALITLETAPCKSLDRYVLHVLDEAGTVELATATGQNGTLPNEVGFRSAFGANPPLDVCMYLTSVAPGGRVFDRAPDTGCVDLGLDGGSGARPFGG